MNPANVARQARAAELANLREESETLRQRVKVLEESGASTEDVTMQVAKKLKQSGPSSQEVEGMMGSGTVVTNSLLMNHFVLSLRRTLQDPRVVLV